MVYPNHYKFKDIYKFLWVSFELFVSDLAVDYMKYFFRFRFYNFSGSSDVKMYWESPQLPDSLQSKNFSGGESNEQEKWN